MVTIGKSIDHVKAKSHMDEYFSRMREMSLNLEEFLSCGDMDELVTCLVMRALLETSSDEMPPSSTKLNSAIKERAKLLRKFLQVGKEAEQMMLMCCSLYKALFQVN